MKRQTLLDVKALFQNKVQETQKEREMLVRSRIDSFNNRHKDVPGAGETTLQPDGKVRTIWGS